MNDEQRDDRIYIAVAIDEEQYSIWLADKPILAGWRDAGKRGMKASA